jgi:murein DD-endopeptidase MepM/ murein hydrolase activator NlpD
MTTVNPRLSYAPRRLESSRVAIDLGNEPPIELGGPRNEGQDSRRTPLRWLAGSALTGLCGLALIGSTLYLDLNQQSIFATAPEFAAPPHRDTTETSSVNAGKGDRLVRPVDIIADKQTFTQTVTMKIGDKEVLKARPYTLLSATLTTTPTNFADSVPPFDPLKLNRTGPEKGDVPLDPGPPADDTESGFTSRDLAKADIVQVKGELSLAETQAQVAEWIKAQTSTDRIAAVAPQMLLMRTSRASVDPLGALAYATTGSVELAAPFANIEVRMEPVNLSTIARSPQRPDGDVARRRLVKLRRGQSFEDLLRANGAPAEALPSIVAAFGVKHGDSPATEGQKIILEYGDGDRADGAPVLVRVSVYADEQLKAAAAINDAGQFAPVAVKGAQPPPARPKPSDEGDAESGGISLYQSLYETALKQNLARPVIDELVRAFMNDVDFQRSTQPGDSMVAFLSEPDEIDPKPVLYFAALTVRDQTYRYYRFQTPDDNLVDYYDENGRSTRKFLLRKPIAEGEMTSGFGMRYHPILHFARLHSGVDWAAPVGTPILAAGNGIVIKSEYDSGYGRRVEIQHANGYVTTYNHMSAFGRGIVAGAHVNQGQIVGYLGQSGLATGPHLHYEVIINGNFVDPMAIRLARTREFDGPMLSQFRKERDRIDQLMTQAPNSSSAGPTAKLN